MVGGLTIIVRKGHDPQSLDKLLSLGPHTPMDAFKPIDCGDPAPANSRNMAEMLASLAASPGAESPEDWVDDGWRRKLPNGEGFHHRYDQTIAEGSWEFYALAPGLSLVTVDFVANQVFPRRHAYQDHLVLSAVLEGETRIEAGEVNGALSQGYCTLYGMQTNEGFETIYEPGKALKWVSVFLDRAHFEAVTGIKAAELPEPVAAFLSSGANLPVHNVPLSNAASLTCRQIVECPYKGSFRKSYLTAKAIELACHILFVVSESLDLGVTGAGLSSSDYRKLHRAMQMIERNIEEPFNMSDLSHAVGLTRQKLQLGFRLLYGDTVGRVRDKVRMDHALKLVRTSNTSMIEIAFSCGYEHPASFTRAFRAAFAMSPVNMRRLAREANAIGKLKTRRR